jgi:hypothetical protein
MATPMKPDIQTENIIYKDYTSTSAETSCQPDTNYPDNLISIMRNHIIIWEDKTEKDK